MSNDGAFRTLTGRGTAQFEVRGSEFIGHSAPVATRDDAEAFVDAVREEYADATHNVPAYRVRVTAGQTGLDDSHRDGQNSSETNDQAQAKTSYMLREYSSDDGEPSGSAGKPALNVLQQREIQNAAVVVTRYYGGTNLGVGGLVRAYSRAVKEAIDDAGVVERRPRERFTVTIDYDDSGDVRGILEGSDCEFDAEYDERVTFEVELAREDVAALQDRLRSATSGRVEIE